MAQFIMHCHTYEINSYADLASVRAQLEELYRQKKITEQTYKLKSKELDRFPSLHRLKK